MKKKIGIISIIVLMTIYIIYYGSTHHILYGNICGSGISGIRLLIMYYIPITILVLLIYLLFRNNNSSMKKCIHCKTSINKDLDICPYCGNYIEGNAESI